MKKTTQIKSAHAAIAQGQWEQAYQSLKQSITLLRAKRNPKPKRIKSALEAVLLFAHQAPPFTHYNELVRTTIHLAESQKAIAAQIHLWQVLGQRTLDSQPIITPTAAQKAREHYAKAHDLAKRYQLPQAQADTAYKLNQLEYRLSHTHYLNAWMMQLMDALQQKTPELFEAIYQRIEAFAQQLMSHALWDLARNCFQRTLDQIVTQRVSYLLDATVDAIRDYLSDINHKRPPNEATQEILPASLTDTLHTHLDTTAQVLRYGMNEWLATDWKTLSPENTQALATQQTQFTQGVLTGIEYALTILEQRLGKPPTAYAVVAEGDNAQNGLWLGGRLNLHFVLADSTQASHPYFTAWQALWADAMASAQASNPCALTLHWHNTSHTPETLAQQLAGSQQLTAYSTTWLAPNKQALTTLRKAFDTQLPPGNFTQLSQHALTELAKHPLPQPEMVISTAEFAQHIHRPFMQWVRTSHCYNHPTLRQPDVTPGLLTLKPGRRQLDAVFIQSLQRQWLKLHVLGYQLWQAPDGLTPDGFWVVCGFQDIILRPLQEVHRDDWSPPAKPKHPLASWLAHLTTPPTLPSSTPLATAAAAQAPHSGERDAFLQSLLTSLAEQSASAVDYYDWYCQLPRDAQAIFKQRIKQTRLPEKENILMHLADFPQPDGTRLNSQKEQQAQQAQLRRFVCEKKPKQKPYIRIQGHYAGEGYLQPEVIRALQEKGFMDRDGRFIDTQATRTQTQGRHLVIPLDINLHDTLVRVHLKPFPEMPALESGIAQLIRRLGGSGAPVGDVLAWQVGKDTPIPVWMSLTVNGQNLSKLLYSPAGQQVLQHADKRQWGHITLTGAVTSPEDLKSDNIIVQPVRQGQKTRMQLVSVDNERGLYPPLVRRSNGSVEVLVKSILYCLDLMQEPVHPSVRAEWLALSPKALLSAWLDELESYETLIQQTFTAQQIKQLFQGQRLTSLRRRLTASQAAPQQTLLLLPLREKLVAELYQQLELIQATLRDNPEATYIDTLQTVQPFIGQYYRALLENHPDPVTRFDAGPGKAYGKTNTHEHHTTQATLPQTLRTMQGKAVKFDDFLKRRTQLLPQARTELSLAHREHQTIRRILEGLTQRRPEAIQQLRALLLSSHRESIIRQLDWRCLTQADGSIDLNYQRQILGTLTSDAARYLYLEGCEALDDATLIPVLKASTGLVRLDISGCHQLTDKSIQAIMKYNAATLERLVLNGLPRTTAFASRAPSLSIRKRRATLFPQLKHLKANRCERLGQIIIKAPQLKRIEIQGNNQLADVWLGDNQTIRVFDVSRTPGLTDERLAQWVARLRRRGANLARLKLHVIGNHHLALVPVEAVLIPDYNGSKSFPFSAIVYFDFQLTALSVQCEFDLQAAQVQSLSRVWQSRMWTESTFSLKRQSKLPMIWGRRLAEYGFLYYLRRKEYGRAYEASLKISHLAVTDRIFLLRAIVPCISAFEDFEVGHPTSLGPGALVIDNKYEGGQGGLSVATALTLGNGCYGMLTMEGVPDGIGLIGAFIIAEVIKSNPEVLTLDLAYNYIDKEIVIIAEALKANTSITCLYLQGNNIGDVGAQALAQMLQYNTTLNRLFLEGNNIGGELQEAIDSLLARNRALALPTEAPSAARETEEASGQPAPPKPTQLTTAQVTQVRIPVLAAQLVVCNDPQLVGPSLPRETGAQITLNASTGDAQVLITRYAGLMRMLQITRTTNQEARISQQDCQHLLLRTRQLENRIAEAIGTRAQQQALLAQQRRTMATQQAEQVLHAQNTTQVAKRSALCQQHSNLGMYYQTLLIRFEEVVGAIKNAASALVELDSSITTGNTTFALQVGGKALSLISKIDPTAISGIAQRGVDWTMQQRQINWAKNLSQRFGSQAKASQMVEAVAYELTRIYQALIQRVANEMPELPPPPTSGKGKLKEKAKAAGNWAKDTAVQLKARALGEYPSSETATLAEFAVAKILTALQFGDLTTVALTVNQLVEMVTQPEQHRLAQAKATLFAKLGLQTVSLHTGRAVEQVPMKGVYTRCGIQVGEGKNTRYYHDTRNAVTQAGLFGYRLGTQVEAETLGLGFDDRPQMRS